VTKLESWIFTEHRCLHWSDLNGSSNYNSRCRISKEQLK